MKKFLILASAILGAGFAGAFALQFVGLIRFNVFHLPLLLGGAAVASVLAIGAVDYSRRPRFCARRARRAAALPRSAVAQKPAENSAAVWTYTTFST